MQELSRAIRSSSVMRFFEPAAERYAGIHLKELDVEEVGPNREMVIEGRTLISFGFDSFLGLDQDPRVKAAVIRGASKWGTQFGASRAFASCHLEVELEQKIARWMGTEAALIFPSVTLTNVGALQGLVKAKDVTAVDESTHRSGH